MDDEQRRRTSDDILDHRLTELERQVHDGFERIDRRLDNLAYVRTETWVEREHARDAALSSIRQDIADEQAARIAADSSNHTLGMWAVGLVAGLVLTALVGFLLFMAQGGAPS